MNILMKEKLGQEPDGLSAGVLMDINKGDFVGSSNRVQSNSHVQAFMTKQENPRHAD